MPAPVIGKLRQLMQNMVQMVMKSINSEILIGDTKYALNSIELEIKLTYSGAIEASLTTVGKFIGTGELSVTGKYALPGAVPTA
jgi:hypothetical protein